jgi:hypothetical protein
MAAAAAMFVAMFMHMGMSVSMCMCMFIMHMFVPGIRVVFVSVPMLVRMGVGMVMVVRTTA